uniref:Uncharacterized protein n=1 Tax=Glossina palpalis gambiensis TaxID=67801 RepID=A0A1B0AZY7_9MUSC
MSSNCLNDNDNNTEESGDSDYKKHQPDENVEYENKEDIHENDYEPNDTANNIWNCGNKDGGPENLYNTGSDDYMIVESNADGADIITNEDNSNTGTTTGSEANTELPHLNRSGWAKKACLKCYNSMKDMVLKGVRAKNLYSTGSDDHMIVESNADGAYIITNENDSNTGSKTGSQTNTKLSHSNRSDWGNKDCLKCYNSMKDVLLKCNNMSTQDQLKIEENAKILFTKTHSEEDGYIDWCDLNLQQKIPLIWAALCEENLSDDPIDNFKQFYAKNAPRSNNTSMADLEENSLIIWETMNTKQRLPFKMQAFITKVAKGEANVEDTDERILESIQ